MKNYILGHALLSCHGQFDSDEEAIAVLGDKFLCARPVTPPGHHILERWTENDPNLSTNFDRGTDISKFGRCVYLQREEEVYGIKQFVVVQQLTIHPTKPEHWENTGGTLTIQVA